MKCITFYVFAYKNVIFCDVRIVQVPTKIELVPLAPRVRPVKNPCFRFVPKISNFYRATACNATHGIAVAILFVCPSVCPSLRQMREL